MSDREQDNDSDSSEDLPNLFEKSSLPWQVAPGEFIWAKYKDGLFWPSLVRQVDKKKRRVRLWYLDAVGKCFNVSFRDIRNFNDRECHELVKSSLVNSPHKERHDKLVATTRNYLYRRAVGIDDNLVEFFSNQYYYTCQKFKDIDFDNNILRTQYMQNNNDKVTNESSSDSDLSESEEENFFKQKSPELFMKPENSLPEDKVDAIVNCITTGQINKYLLDIFNRKISSNRNKVFDEYMRLGKKDILYKNISSATILNQDKQIKISLYLLNMYENINPKSDRQYVFYVWFPEALDKALELVESGENVLLPNKPVVIPDIFNVKRSLFVEDNEIDTNDSVETSAAVLPKRSRTVSPLKKQSKKDKSKKKNLFVKKNNENKTNRSEDSVENKRSRIVSIFKRQGKMGWKNSLVKNNDSMEESVEVKTETVNTPKRLKKRGRKNALVRKNNNTESSVEGRTETVNTLRQRKSGRNNSLVKKNDNPESSVEVRTETVNTLKRLRKSGRNNSLVKKNDDIESSVEIKTAAVITPRKQGRRGRKRY